MGMKQAALIVGLVGLAGMATLAGCMSPYNDRSTLGRDDVVVEAIADPGPVYGPIVDNQPLTLDRANWEWVTYYVPVDGTMHNPTWRWWNGHNFENARDRGEMPNEMTALILKGDDNGAETGEAFATPFVALGEIFAMPVMLFIDPQFSGSWSPKWSYERTDRVALTPGAGFSDQDHHDGAPTLEVKSEPERSVMVEPE